MEKFVISLLLTACLSVGMMAGSKGKNAEIREDLHPYAVKTPGGQRYGYIVPQTGVWVIPPSFEQALPFEANGLAKVMQDGKFGVIDKKGCFVVKPVYQMISPFQDGMAMVQTEQDWGFIDERGAFIAMPGTVESGQLFKEGLAGIQINGQWGFLNRKGQIAVPAAFDSVHEFENGLAAVVINNKWGYVNKEGNLTITPDLDAKPSFYNGYAAASQNGRWGYLSEVGSWAVEPWFEAALGFFSGLAAVKENGKWGFIDSTGSLVIEPQFDGAGSFEQDLAPAKLGAQWGYINRQGQVVIAPQFERAAVFSGKLAQVVSQGRWGFINRLGKMKIPPQYEDVRLWNSQPGQTLYWISSGGKYGLMDGNGLFLLPLVFDEIKQLNFKNPDLEYIAVCREQKYGILNMRGEWIIQPVLWRLPDAVYLASKIAVIYEDFYGADGAKIQQHYANLMASGYRFQLNLQYEAALSAFRAALQINPQDQAASWAINQLLLQSKQ